jgi:phosphate:Na+ symporter
MFSPDMPHARANLIGSLIEEEDFTASLGESLYQVSRRIERQPFGTTGRALVNETLDRLEEALAAVIPLDRTDVPHVDAAAAPRLPALAELRERCLRLGRDLPWVERGSILALLGSVERAFYLIERIDAERRSVLRVVPETAPTPKPRADDVPDAVPAPA